MNNTPSISAELQAALEQGDALAVAAEDRGTAYGSLSSRVYVAFTSDRINNRPYLNLAIEFARRAIGATQDQGPNLAIRLDRLSSFLREKYMLGDGDELLQHAIQYGRQATRTEIYSAQDVEDRADFYANLADLLLMQHQLKGGDDTISEAVQSARHAVAACSQENKAIHLNTLASVLSTMFTHGQMLEYSLLEEAVQSVQMAIELEPEKCGFWSTAANIRVLLDESANQTDPGKQDEDLKTALSNAERALELAQGSEDRDEILAIQNTLCKILGDTHSRYGRLQDLERSIELGRLVLAGTRSTYPRLVQRSQALSNALAQLFEREGDTRKIEEAIQISTTVLDSSAFKNAPNEQAMHYNNLALRFLAQFQYTHSKRSISKAIEHAASAVRASQSTQERAHCSATLAAAYSSRSTTMGSESDIDESIRILAMVKDDVAIAHKWRVHDFLARAYAQKFERTNEIDVLDFAVQDQFHSLLHLRPDGPLRSGLLLHTSFLRGLRYSQEHDVSSLETASSEAAEVMKLLPDNHPNLPGVLRYLAELYGRAFEISGENDQLEIALTHLRKARELAPSGHHSQAAIFNTYGTLLSLQDFGKDRPQHTSDSIAFFRKAYESSASPVIDRIRGGRAGGLLLIATSAWTGAASLLVDTVKLLPKLAPRELDRQDQQFYLMNLSDLSGWAASAALNANWSVEDALSLFEAGRGLIASGAADLQTDVLELEHQAPDLAHRYSDLKYGLRTLGTALESLENMTSQNAWGTNHASQRLKIAEDLSQLEELIRRVPGFENFMQIEPEPSKGLVESDQRAIVAFNITEIRSDAFIVTKSGVNVLALPDLELSHVREISKAFVGPDRLTDGLLSTFGKRNRQLKEHLGWLWDTAVKPVLQQLGFMSTSRSPTPPEVTWINSGVIGMMPFHAAGRSWANTENTVFHVISSYSPTFRALRLSKSKRPNFHGLGQVLILKMPETMGYPDLGADEEASSVELSARAVASRVLVKSYASREEALHLFDQFSTIFLGCHGETDSKNPSASGILFADGPQKSPEKLTVRDIAAKALPRALLVYLSACSTAENVSEGLVDEVIHLASALQSAGFPHVIGTMWQVEDETASLLARLFFENVAQQASSGDSPSALDFALALHQAVDEVRSGRAYSAPWRKNASDNVTMWAPFVHIGY